MPGPRLSLKPRGSLGAGGKFFISLFFLVFLLVGVGMVYLLLFKPLYKIAVARQWPTVPCLVISSRVKSHDSNDGTTYSVDILYSYEFNGREFESSRFDFMIGSSSGYRSKQVIVDQHPPGARVVCYVNPNDPSEAVLQRDFTPSMWFGLMPMVFVAVGGGGLFYTLRQSRLVPRNSAARTQFWTLGLVFLRQFPSRVNTPRTTWCSSQKLRLGPNFWACSLSASFGMESSLSFWCRSSIAGSPVMWTGS